jgi:hypothetical protein
MEEKKIPEITIYTNGRDIKIKTELKEIDIETAEAILNSTAKELMGYFNKDLADTIKFYKNIIICCAIAVVVLFITVLRLLCA